MDQNLAVLWGEQADPKSLGGGPKPILRTGFRIMLMTMLGTIMMMVMMMMMVIMMMVVMVIILIILINGIAACAN